MNWMQKLDRIRHWIAVYLGAVSCVWVPLFIKGSYFGLIGLKARTYLYAAVPAIAVMAVVVVIELISGRRKPDAFSILLVLIGAWALFSSLTCSNPKQSLWGNKGWWVGSIMTVVLVISTIIVAKCFAFRAYMMLPVMAANMVINLLAIAQSAGYDPFGLLVDITDRQRYVYLGTIGNSNCYSGYLCLTLPLFWGAFMLCKERSTEVVYGAAALLGFMGIIMAASDSTIVGLGFCTLFMLPFVFRSEQYLKRAGALLVMYGVCLLFVRFCPLFAVKLSRTADLSALMIASPVSELICVCGIVVYLAAGKVIGSGKGRIILIALEVILIGVICFMAVKSVLEFNDDWGNRRGMIWRVGWENFLRYSPAEKIKGVGPEMLFIVFEEMKVNYGRNVVTAHCEPLQILLSEGIVGLGLYIVFWGRLLMTFFRKKSWQNSAAVFFFPLAAYWGQSIFCSVYPVTAVLFGFMAGVYLKQTLE